MSESMFIAHRLPRFRRRLALERDTQLGSILAGYNSSQCFRFQTHPDRISAKQAALGRQTIVRLFQQITTCSRSLCSHLVQSTFVRDSEHPIVRRCVLRSVELRVCGARPFCKPHELFTSLFARQLLLLASTVFCSKTHS